MWFHVYEVHVYEVQFIEAKGIILVYKGLEEKPKEDMLINEWEEFLMGRQKILMTVAHYMIILKAT